MTPDSFRQFRSSFLLFIPDFTRALTYIVC